MSDKTFSHRTVIPEDNTRIRLADRNIGGVATVLFAFKNSHELIVSLSMHVRFPSVFFSDFLRDRTGQAISCPDALGVESARNGSFQTLVYWWGKIWGNPAEEYPKAGRPLLYWQCFKARQRCLESHLQFRSGHWPTLEGSPSTPENQESVLNPESSRRRNHFPLDMTCHVMYTPLRGSNHVRLRRREVGSRFKEGDA